MGDHQFSWMPRRAPQLSSGGRSLALLESSRSFGYQDHQKKQIILYLQQYFIERKDNFHEKRRDFV